MRVTKDWMGFTEIEDNSKKVKIANHIFDEMYKLIDLVDSKDEINKCGIENDNFKLEVTKEELGILVVIRQNKSIMTNEERYRNTHKYDIIFIDNDEKYNFFLQANNYVTKE